MSAATKRCTLFRQSRSGFESDEQPKTRRLPGAPSQDQNDHDNRATAHAFRKAGRQRRYHDAIMVTTLAPCGYCSGLIVQLQDIGEA